MVDPLFSACLDIAAGPDHKGRMTDIVKNVPTKNVAVLGGGPAGLMAAEHLAGRGFGVTVFDQMPSVGRKFLMAGRGGLNLTHAEALPGFLAHFAEPALRDSVAAFPPAALIAWCEGLGEATFIGSSQRVFPRSLKASPLLRAWLGRLAAMDVGVRPRHRWVGGLAPDKLRFETPGGAVQAPADAMILALGGASWPRLGSDGAWAGHLPGVAVAPLVPSNMGFRVAWSALFQARGQGEALKRIAITHGTTTVRGEALVTAQGIEGGAIYALSAALRDAIAAHGPVSITLDLRPDLSRAEVALRLDARARAETVSASLRKAIGLSPVAIALMQEVLHQGRPAASLAEVVKALPLRLEAPAPIARAISSAGGVAWGEVDAGLMLRQHPGVFVCGEMLDWEAPTGGYLLQGCFSTAIRAADGCAAWLDSMP